MNADHISLIEEEGHSGSLGGALGLGYFEDCVVSRGQIVFSSRSGIRKHWHLGSVR